MTLTPFFLNWLPRELAVVLGGRVARRDEALNVELVKRSHQHRAQAANRRHVGLGGWPDDRIFFRHPDGKVYPAGLHLRMTIHLGTALQRWKPGRPMIWAIGLAVMAVIGLFDYATGTELRTYPLYYAPVSLLAWYDARRGAVISGILASAAWVLSNAAAGMRFSSESIWVANTGLHIASFVGVGLVIATLHAAKTEAQLLSRTDSLTRLLNGHAFFTDAAPLLALCRRGGRPVTVAYVDLDNFKLVNDRHGHAAGDALLATIADAMRRTVRPSDLCARLHGDEFALLLPELPESEAAGVLERVRANIAAAASSIEPAVTASVGGVTFLKSPSSLEDLVHRADVLMYSAKQGGRNRLSLQVHDG